MLTAQHALLFSFLCRHIGRLPSGEGVEKSMGRGERDVVGEGVEKSMGRGERDAGGEGVGKSMGRGESDVVGEGVEKSMVMTYCMTIYKKGFCTTVMLVCCSLRLAPIKKEIPFSPENI